MGKAKKAIKAARARKVRSRKSSCDVCKRKLTDKNEWCHLFNTLMNMTTIEDVGKVLKPSSPSVAIKQEPVSPTGEDVSKARAFMSDVITTNLPGAQGTPGFFRALLSFLQCNLDLQCRPGCLTGDVGYSTIYSESGSLVAKRFLLQRINSNKIW